MGDQGIFSSIRISGSGLSASRAWLNVASENIANAQTTKTAEGGPYKKKSIQFQETLLEKIIRNKAQDAKGNTKRKLEATDTRHLEMSVFPYKSLQKESLNAVVASVVEDSSQGRRVYEPDHPDADQDGYVLFPNVNIIKEMMELMIASRAYEANTTALTQARNMALKALEI